MGVLEMHIRFGYLNDRFTLEDIQRQASLGWPDYRDAILKHPDSIHLPPEQLDENRARVAETAPRNRRLFGHTFAGCTNCTG